MGLSHHTRRPQQSKSYFFTSTFFPISLSILITALLHFFRYLAYSHFCQVLPGRIASRRGRVRCSLIVKAREVMVTCTPRRYELPVVMSRAPVETRIKYSPHTLFVFCLVTFDHVGFPTFAVDELSYSDCIHTHISPLCKAASVHKPISIL
jgi:hypothetical protein